MAPSSVEAIAKRVKDIRRVLGPWHGKLLPRGQLARQLGVDASTVKKWETAEVRINSENALKLAKLANCDVEWILAGEGRAPPRIQVGGDSNRKHRVVAESPRRRERDHVPGLAPDDIASEAVKVIAPLIERLAEENPINAAMWLQAAAIDVNRQDVTEVYDLIELAQELLRRARKAGYAGSDRSGTQTVHTPK